MLPTAPGNSGTSTRPYLIRALHDWCTDNGFTPYIAVFVDASVQVPLEYVKNNEIVLNIGFDATTAMKLGDEFIEFKARFGGSSRELCVPVDHVIAIYARENGQGMAFPAPTELHVSDDSGAEEVSSKSQPAAGGGLRLAAASDGASSSDEIASGAADSAAPTGDDEPESPVPAGGRPSLKRIK